MSDSYGPIVANAARMYCNFSISHANTYTRVAVTFYLQMVNGASSTGTYPSSWSGYWGSSGQSVYRAIGANGMSQVVTGAYDIPRTGSDYNVTFQAAAACYWGTPSHSITITIPKAWTVPPAPSPYDLDQITATSMRYRFSGNGDGGRPITRWEFQYSVNSNFSGATTVTSSGTSTVTGLKNKTRYYFRSRGVNSVGNGSWSATKSAVTLGLPDAPTLKAGTITATSAAFTLTDPSYTGGGITGRQTQLSTNSTFTALVGSTSTSSSPSWTGLTRARTYYARSRVQNSTGWSGYSSTVTIKTNVQLPSAPTGYAVTDIASTTAYVSTPGVPDTGGGTLTNVRAQVNTSASETGATLVTEGGFRPTFLQGLTPGQKYYVRLAVQNTGTGGGWGPYGAWVEFTMRDDVPTPPLSLAAQVLGDTSAMLSWLPPADLLGSDLLGYTIRVATDPAFAMNLQIISAPAEAETYLLDGLQQGTRYYVQVSALSSGGPGSASNVVNFLTTGTPPVPQPVWMRVGAQWRPGKLWLNVDGVWKAGKLWLNVDDEWREG